MSDSLCFFVHCNPPKSTHQASLGIMRHKSGKQFIGKMGNSKGTQAKDSLMSLIAPYRPAEAFHGPVSLSVSWDYPWRSSEPKRNRLLGYKWCDTRPDCDNLAKLLKDVLTTLNFWTDDSQVAKLIFGKRWSNDPGIGIKISSLVGDTCLK